MYPAPHDALPLPARPSLEQYKKLAKELMRICKSSDPAALGAWSKEWVATLVKLAGLTITREMPVRIDHWAVQLEEFARSKLSGSVGKPCVLADAHFVLARVHGFESWPKFVRHVDELVRANSPVSSFEAAADAIVDGDLATLRRLLGKNPDLVRARSTREHGATLLHYVAANGVEGYRQRTPKNAVEAAEMLLRAGADADATAEIYGDSASTLGLAATSIHPQRAGVQIALLQLLLDHGARIDRTGSAGNRRSLIKTCFANGRGEAAEFLSHHRAPLDLEEAAGVGNIDAVRSFFDYNGALQRIASEEQLREGFLWACQFGRNRVVEFLIARGIDLSAQDRNGQTGLHHASIGAQPETVKILLKHGAPLEVKNNYGGTVLGQAVWSALNGVSPKPYLPVIEFLLEAGARIEPSMEDELARLLRRRSAETARG
ncbi:MAG: ankyrin repeat domain-containing protein [Terracidiphilus sp.]